MSENYDYYWPNMILHFPATIIACSAMIAYLLRKPHGGDSQHVATRSKKQFLFDQPVTTKRIQPCHNKTNEI